MKTLRSPSYFAAEDITGFYPLPYIPPNIILDGYA